MQGILQNAKDTPKRYLGNSWEKGRLHVKRN